MAAGQPLPDWLRPVTLTFQDSDRITTGLVQLPIPYSGPSIPLSWPFTDLSHPTQTIHAPAPTQTVHFYDGSGPFTVVNGVIITRPLPTTATSLAARPQSLNPAPPPITTGAIPAPRPSAPPPTVIVYTTVTAHAPAQPTNNTQTSDQDARGRSLTVLMAGFIILLILLVFVVLVLLIFLLRRQRLRKRRVALFSPAPPRPPVHYEFNSELLPQHHHGSQSSPHQIQSLREQHRWAPAQPADLIEHEKLDPKPEHDHSMAKTETRHTGWTRFQRALRTEIHAVLRHFSIDPPQDRTRPADVVGYTNANHPGFHNPYHDPSISTETFARVSRWCQAILTPTSSFLRAPRSLKSLRSSDHSPLDPSVDSDAIERSGELPAPFIFNRSSTVSQSLDQPDSAPLASDSQPPPGYQSSHPKLSSPVLEFAALKAMRRAAARGKQAALDRSGPGSFPRSGSSRKTKSGKSSRSSRKRIPDHPPLLEPEPAFGDASDDDGLCSLGDRSDSPLEHFTHTSFSPLSLRPVSGCSPVSKQPITPPGSHQILSTSARRLRVKKHSWSPLALGTGAPLHASTSSPQSLSYQSSTPIQSSPGRILVLKKRSDLTPKLRSPADIYLGRLSSHQDFGDEGSKSTGSPTLRFPLPPSGSMSGAGFAQRRSLPGATIDDRFIEVVPTSHSSNLTTEDDEVLYTGQAVMDRPRRSSISNMGGVSELGVFERGSATGEVARPSEDDSYVSEDLFYVRPRLAQFRDGHWTTSSERSASPRLTIDQLPPVTPPEPTSSRGPAVGGSGAPVPSRAKGKKRLDQPDALFNFPTSSSGEGSSEQQGRAGEGRSVSTHWTGSGRKDGEDPTSISQVLAGLGLKGLFAGSSPRSVSLPMGRDQSAAAGGVPIKRFSPHYRPVSISAAGGLAPPLFPHRGLSPLDRLKNKAAAESDDAIHGEGSLGTDEHAREADDEDLEEEDDEADENSRLLSRQSVYSRATLGQRLVLRDEIASQRGSLISGGGQSGSYQSKRSGMSSLGKLGQGVVQGPVSKQTSQSTAFYTPDDQEGGGGRNSSTGEFMTPMGVTPTEEET